MMNKKTDKALIEKLSRDYRHEFEVRSLMDGEYDDPNYYILEGRATPFNSETVLFRIDDIDYKEIIEPTAFVGADMTDVVFKYNHSDNVMPVARTRNKTLELFIKEDGLYMRAKLDKKVAAAVELYESVRSGLLDRMSFAFSIEDESFDQAENRWTIHKVRKVFDVAAVDFPAYDDTVIYARRMQDLERFSTALESEQERAKAEALNLAKLKARIMTK